MRIEVLRFGAVVQVQHMDVAEVSAEDDELRSGMRNACRVVKKVRDVIKVVSVVRVA